MKHREGNWQLLSFALFHKLLCKSMVILSLFSVCEVLWNWAGTGGETEQAVGRLLGSMCAITARDEDAQSAMVASWISQVKTVKLEELFEFRRMGSDARELPLREDTGNFAESSINSIACNKHIDKLKNIVSVEGSYRSLLKSRERLGKQSLFVLFSEGFKLDALQASFDPPGLTVAVKRDRAIENLLNGGSKFVVNILSEGNHKGLMKQLLKQFKPGEDRFAGLDITVITGGQPSVSAAVEFWQHG